MIDNGKYTTLYSSPEEIRKILQSSSITFDRTAKNKHTGEEIHLYTFRSFTFAVNYRLCKVSLTGSLTRFCKGNNYSNISFAELVEAIQCICRTLKKGPQDIQVHRAEFATIIKTPLKPLTYLDHFLSYKKKEFYKQVPPPWSAKPLLSFCSLQQFVIKFYDTSQWHKLPGINLLKYEIRFTRAQKILSVMRSKGPLTLNHFLDEANFKALGNFALQVYQTIDKDSPITPEKYKDLTQAKRRLLYAGERTAFWRLERSVNRNSCRHDRKEYLHLKRQLKCDYLNPMKDLERRIINSVKRLIKLGISSERCE